jgi:hypothetical protein
MQWVGNKESGGSREYRVRSRELGWRLEIGEKKEARSEKRERKRGK